MTVDIDFYEIEDEFFRYTKDGLSRNEIADGFGFDRYEFSLFIESNSYALTEERRAKFQFKLAIKQGISVAVAKGNLKALEMVTSTEDKGPSLVVEFKRGDMRTPDEIIITNTENGEKKSLASLRS